MKRLVLALLIVASSLTPAHAAPRALNQIANVGDLQSNVGILVDKNTIYTFGTAESATADGVISTLDSKGNLISRRVIDGGGDEYISAGVFDGQGSLWLVGGDTSPRTQTAVDTTTVVNPDNIAREQIPQLRNDITTLTVWRYLLATGDVTRFALDWKAPVLPVSIAADSAGASIVGIYILKGAPQNFLISMTPQGLFGKSTTIGGPGTTINALARNSDGSIDLFGASSEPLGSTKLVGKRDGVLIKTRSGKITSVVRSSAPKADREWLSAGAGTFLVGTVKTGKVVEVAITKFAQFKPVWTTRLSSTGVANGILNSSGAYVAYSTNQGSTVVTFTTKGAPVANFASSAMKYPIGMGYSKEIGLVILGATENGAGIFTPTSG